MKGFQLFLVLVLFHSSAAHVLQNEDGTSVDLDKDEFCTDVSQYSPKYYEDVTEVCCTTTYVPNCKRKNKRVCMDVTNTICKPFAKPDYTIGMKMNPGQGGAGGDGGSPGNGGSPGSGNNNGFDGPNNSGSGGPGNHGGSDNNRDQGFGGPGNDGGSGSGSGGAAPNTPQLFRAVTQCELETNYVDMNECAPKEVNFKHTKKVPQCEDVTSLNCETGWKVDDNGNKVWSGEEECEEVTWQECKLVDKEVDFPAIESNCKPAPAEPYNAPISAGPRNIPVPVPEMKIVKEPICEAVVQKECVDVPYDDCSEPIRKEECREFQTRVPKQDFIHKKKCLLPSDIERQAAGGYGGR